MDRRGGAASSAGVSQQHCSSPLASCPHVASSSPCSTIYAPVERHPSAFFFRGDPPPRTDAREARLRHEPVGEHAPPEREETERQQRGEEERAEVGDEAVRAGRLGAGHGAEEREEGAAVARRGR
ncbi:hypothetical protein THAOC_11291, partial [Thalassiosira oceanica]